MNARWQLLHGQPDALHASPGIQLRIDLPHLRPTAHDRLAHRGDPDTRRLVLSQLVYALSGQIEAPARWLAGNHDEPLPMEQAAAGSDVLDPVVDIGQWRVVMLNSAVPGSVPGWLADDQLQVLEHALREAPERHHLICFHHQPVSIECAWMAPIGLRNADALFDLLQGYPQVRALLWGHVHQEWDQVRDGVRLLASPSTCIQFEPRSDDFKVGEQAPGYRWLRLHDDGRLDTGVSRVTDFAFTVDYGSNGY